MSDTPQYRRRREDGAGPPVHGVVPGRRSSKDRRASASEQLARVEADLRQPKPLLRFSEAVEQGFQMSREPRRVRHFVILAVAGFITFDLFLIPDAMIVPDILRLTKLIHLCVVTPVAALHAYLMHRRVVRPESIIALLFMTYGTALWGASTSHAPNAVFLLFTLPIFLIFSNIALPLPFLYAAGYTAVTMLAVGCSILVNPHLDYGIRTLMMLIEISMGGYTLIATYRLEVAERRSYLLTLRETLRGETLAKQNRELSDLSETDGLTGVPNRRAFDRSLERLWNEHLQSRTPVGLIMIDIDHFKRLNDTHGHNNGDICLRKAADRLRALMRPHQTVARYGGEEFAVLLEGEGAYQADQVAERLRSEIEIMPVSLVGQDHEPHHITISLGCVTVIPRMDLNPGDLFIAADKALYTAKHGGRNRVHVHSLDPIRQPEIEPAPVLRPSGLAFLDAIAKN